MTVVRVGVELVPSVGTVGEGNRGAIGGVGVVGVRNAGEGEGVRMVREVGVNTPPGETGIVVVGVVAPSVVEAGVIVG